MAPPDRALRRALPAIVRAIARRRTAILGYHGVSEDSGHDLHNLIVPPTAFRQQLELLLEAGFEFVTVESLADEIGHGTVAPGRIALSFDDGMEDNHRVVLPMLREYGIPATFYVVTGLIGQPNPFLGGGARMMTVEELRDAASQGVEVGAHSVMHADLSTLDYEACLGEMAGSREALETMLGRAPRTFAYPFCRYSPEAMAAARDAGYSIAVTCSQGGWLPYEVPRAMISSGDRLGVFTMKLGGAYEPIAARYRALKIVVGPRRQRPTVRSG